MNPIYLDHNGTTPVDPEVAALCAEMIARNFGNPSTRSSYGQRAKEAMELARQQVAELVQCPPEDITFTSGASEANNWLIKGMAFASPGLHIITTAVEHPSIGKACEFVERLGLAQVTTLEVDVHGQVQPDRLLQVLRPQTQLVTVMHSNNEIGTCMPLREIADALRGRDLVFHSDAAQSLGKLAFPMRDLGLQAATLAGHKLYAPKGVGALVFPAARKLEPLVHGAGQEGGRRSGTENVALIAGFGLACELARQRQALEEQRQRRMRDQLWEQLQRELPGQLVRHGHPEQCLPNTLNVSFLGVTGAELLARCPGLAASTGPACHDGQIRLSGVLQALRIDPEVGKGAVRLSLGKDSDEQQITEVARHLVMAYRELGRK